MDGRFAPALILMGQFRPGNVILLGPITAPGFRRLPGADRLRSFSHSKHRRELRPSAARINVGKGEGHEQPYNEFVGDLTIDTGRGIPASSSIEHTVATYLCPAVHVTLRAAPVTVLVGLSMTPQMAGAALIRDLPVHGFATGNRGRPDRIWPDLENIRLDGQAAAAIRNDKFAFPACVTHQRAGAGAGHRNMAVKGLYRHRCRPIGKFRRRVCRSRMPG